MVVTFCGHSQIFNADRLKIKQWLDVLLDQLILDGAAEFLLGGYGEFDLLAAQLLVQKKEKYPHIRSVFAQAYLNVIPFPELYDETVYPPLEAIPPKYAIRKRNEWMVSSSDVVIAYVTHSWGGAAKTLEYAQKRKKIIYHFYPVS